MKALLLLFALILLVSCGGNSESADTLSDTEVSNDTADMEVEVPVEEHTGVSCSTVEDYGSITARDRLISEFEEENLVHGESWYAEGTVSFDHSVLTDPENGQVIKYLWEEDGNTLSHIEAGYYVFDESYRIVDTQEVYSDCGVYTGMSLQELREWNGADFDFLGFGWDYEGGIVEEEGSRIAECPVEIKLSFDLQIEIPEEHRDMYGDRMFNTADDMAQDAPVLVDRLTFYSPGN